MGLKNVMVHLDSTPRCAVRLRYAVELATQHGARLLGVFGQRAHAVQVGAIATWPSPAYVQARDDSRAAFEQATTGLAQAQWHDVNRGGDSELLHHITEQARNADLVILGQHPEGSQHLSEDLVAEVIVRSGRPVLVMPFVGNYPDIGKHPLIAWSNTREAARALNDALPLIQGCEKAHVLAISGQSAEAEAACSAVERQLTLHGVASRSEVLLVEDFGIMDLLLNRVTDRGADMLVMGAQSASSLPFENRGSGTRYILRHMTVPVLMSH